MDVDRDFCSDFEWHLELTDNLCEGQGQLVVRELKGEEEKVEEKKQQA